MARQPGIPDEEDIPESERIFNHWIEIVDLMDGTRREFAIKAIKRVHLPRTGEPLRPDQCVLRLEDGESTIEGLNLDDLIEQLRIKYPDTRYERWLKMERDLEAERTRRNAIDSLIKLVAQSAVDRLFEKQHE